MNNNYNKYALFYVLILWVVSAYAAMPEAAVSKQNLTNPLHYYPDFQGKTIITNTDILSLDVPKRAEDAAFMPTKINLGQGQNEIFIEKIWLFIDKNPVPLAGLFEFGEASVHADLAFRTRVNEHSFVRVIAQTKSGQLFEDSHFVKATGGCSAPPATEASSDDPSLGKTRISTREDIGKKTTSLLTEVKIRHPNLTGFQMDQATRLRKLPHFITHIKVSLAGKKVFSAETSISISEDPNFRFYLPKTEDNSQLKIEIIDSKKLRFANVFALDK